LSSFSNKRFIIMYLMLSVRMTTNIKFTVTFKTKFKSHLFLAPFVTVSELLRHFFSI